MCVGKYQSMVPLHVAVDCADSVGYEHALSSLKSSSQHTDLCDIHAFLCLCMFMRIFLFYSTSCIRELVERGHDNLSLKIFEVCNSNGLYYFIILYKTITKTYICLHCTATCA